MKRWMFLAVVLALALLLLLPPSYDGTPVLSGDLPPLDTVPARPRAPAEGLLDLNEATAEQLQTLPEIGPARAQAILDYRTRNGPFQSVDELAAVDGIGVALLDTLRDLICVTE